VPVLVALLRARDADGQRGLTSQEASWAHAAITESSNEAVLELFADLEKIRGGLAGASAYVQASLELSGDQETVVTRAQPPPGAVTTFGQTEWRPSEAVVFYRALANGCLLPAHQTHYVLNLMEHIVPSESWGLGSAHFRSVAFKGGWGPNASGAYLVRQSGIVDVGASRGVAVAIVARPSSGLFADGVQIVTRTANWLHNELLLTPRAPIGCLRDRHT
jgi:hypothetical protein